MPNSDPLPLPSVSFLSLTLLVLRLCPRTLSDSASWVVSGKSSLSSSSCCGSACSAGPLTALPLPDLNLTCKSTYIASFMHDYLPKLLRQERNSQAFAKNAGPKETAISAKAKRLAPLEGETCKCFAVWPKLHSVSELACFEHSLAQAENLCPTFWEFLFSGPSSGLPSRG